MLFNSYVFIFAFLPVVFLVYFLLNKWRLIVGAKVWLVLSSLFFYSWWNVLYLPLILTSMLVNYLLGVILGRQRTSLNKKAVLNRKAILCVGLIFNLGLLGYYKYADFFINNVNALFATNLPLLQLALPLAISFFTFQQIAYLVDAYRLETKEYSFLDYALFVSFFPQLIAGPIVYHREMMPQFTNVHNKVIRYKHIVAGLFIFFIGLFKKVGIADTFAIWATQGFDHTEVLTFVEAWLVSLSYTFQLYFDFSGYTDMAIGAAMLFNIRLPFNFNSPYKAVNIQEFWKRWHITLGRFLTQYVYIPLGGNRKGRRRTYLNLFLVFLLSGLWHGAGWTFLLWGALHGIAMIIQRWWQTSTWKMSTILAWLLTFNFVNITWVFFRAETWSDALKVLTGMLGFNGLVPSGTYTKVLQTLNDPTLIFDYQYFLLNLQAPLFSIVLLISFFLIVIAAKNSVQLMNRFQPTWGRALFASFITVVAILFLNRVSEFLYFNF